MTLAFSLFVEPRLWPLTTPLAGLLPALLVPGQVSPPASYGRCTRWRRRRPAGGRGLWRVVELWGGTGNHTGLAQVTGGRGSAAGPVGVHGLLSAVPCLYRLPNPVSGRNQRKVRSGCPAYLRPGAVPVSGSLLELTLATCHFHGCVAGPGGED